MKQNLVEQVDFYCDQSGRIVFTKHYHLERGFCCGNACLHCPYDYENVPEPKKSGLSGDMNENKQVF